MWNIPQIFHIAAFGVQMPLYGIFMEYSSLPRWGTGAHKAFRGQKVEYSMNIPCSGIWVQWCDSINYQWCDSLHYQWCDSMHYQWCDNMHHQWCDTMHHQWCLYPILTQSQCMIRHVWNIPHVANMCMDFPIWNI